MTITHRPATAAEEFQLREHSPAQRIQHVLHTRSWVSPALILVLSCLAFSVAVPDFFTANSLSLIVQQATITAALACGQAIIIITAGVDLSIGAIMLCASLIMAQLVVKFGLPGVLALLITIGFGAACGALNGSLVTRVKMPPFIVTLGTFSIFTALSLQLTNGQTISGTSLGSLLNWTGNAFAIGHFTVTYGIIVVALMFGVLMYALNHTAWGRHVYTVGDNRDAARLSGIRVGRVLMSVYILAGITYAITGWVLIGRTGGASPSNGVDANLDSITAVVIGGVSLFGGRGSLVGAVIGALIVQVFYNGLFLAGVAPSYQEMALGILVLGAVGVDQWIKRVRA
jgi:fructose transport system permease protein